MTCLIIVTTRCSNDSIPVVNIDISTCDPGGEGMNAGGNKANEEVREREIVVGTKSWENKTMMNVWQIIKLPLHSLHCCHPPLHRNL